MGPADLVRDPSGAPRRGRYDARTALVVVDVQNDFADPSGSLHVAGAPGIIEPLNREIAAARAASALVVFTQDWHPETTPHFAKDGGTWPVHCVGGTWGAELHPGLDAGDTPRGPEAPERAEVPEGPEGPERVERPDRSEGRRWRGPFRIRKGVGGEDGYSGFTVADPTSGARTPTGLEDLLRERGIERVVIAGLATDYCVKATALDAATLGFGTVVLTGVVRAVDLVPGDGERALEEMREQGITLA